MNETYEFLRRREKELEQEIAHIRAFLGNIGNSKPEKRGRKSAKVSVTGKKRGRPAKAVKAVQKPATSKKRGRPAKAKIS